MDRVEKKRLRMELLKLMDNPKGNEKRITEIGRLLKGKEGILTKLHFDGPSYIEWRNSGKTRKEIADMFGISLTRLHYEVRVLREEGLLPNGAIRYKVKKFTMTKEEYLTCGLTNQEIIEKHKISHATLSNRLKEWGLSKKKQYDLSYEDYCSYKGQLLLDKEICDLIGCNRSTLYFKKLKWKEEGKRV